MSTYSSDTPSLPTFLSLFLSLFFPFSNYASAESDSRGGSKLDPRPRFPHREKFSKFHPDKVQNSSLAISICWRACVVLYLRKISATPSGYFAFASWAVLTPKKYTPPPLLGVKIQIATPRLSRPRNFLSAFLGYFRGKYLREPRPMCIDSHLMCGCIFLQKNKDE